MSKWTANENRIDVPYARDSIYVCVEHPGTVENEERALETIGGIDNVIKTYNTHSQRLPLRWRPEDKYSKPCYADRTATTNILMKVKKRRRKSDGKEEYKVEILGRIETTYKFQSMCDFQFLPVRKKEDGSYENIYNKIVINKFDSDRQQYFSQDVPLFIPPILFSRVDKPIDFLYRQDIEHRKGYQNPDKTRPANLIGTVRQRRSLYTIFVNFGEEIPTEPLKQAIDKLSSDYVDPKGADVVKELFEQKPLWLKVELEHKTGYSPEKLKIYLPALCFYWLDGPWRAQWNRFGFNPTKDPTSKIHQTLDFRLRHVKSNMLDVKAKRSDFKVVQRNRLSRMPKHNVRIDIKALGGDSSEKGSEEINKELYYKFIPGINPPQRMMYYPIQYIQIEEVQRLIHQNDGKEVRCTDTDGWCVDGFHDQCRDIMYNNINGYEDYTKIWKNNKKKRRIQETVYTIKAPTCKGAVGKTGKTAMDVDEDGLDETEADDSEMQPKDVARSDIDDVDEEDDDDGDIGEDGAGLEDNLNDELDYAPDETEMSDSNDEDYVP